MAKVIGALIAPFEENNQIRVVISCTMMPTGADTFPAQSFQSSILTNGTLTANQLNTALENQVKTDFNTLSGGLTISSSDILIQKLS